MNEEQLRTTKKQKSMMNNNKFYLTVLTVATLVLATACSENGFVQEKTSEANNGNVEQPLVTFTGAYTDKQTEPPQQSRTSLSHQVGSGAVVYWSAGDKIWVKDNGGTFSQSSTGELRDDNKTGIFQLNGTYTGDTHEVRYTGLNATNANQVTIAAVQNQTVFNNAGHIGTSGDCGTATAIKQANGNYKFKLEHKASYLCLLPRTANNYVKRSKLFKVEITSEDNIAGVYDFSTGRLSSTPVSNASKTVTVNLGNGGAAVSNATTNISSALYAVIAPGTHNMRIRYWLRNTTDNPGGTIEGTVTKYITLTCEGERYTTSQPISIRLITMVAAITRGMPCKTIGISTSGTAAACGNHHCQVRETQTIRSLPMPTAGIIRLRLQQWLMPPVHAKVVQISMKLYGMVKKVTHAGMLMSYGASWDIYTKGGRGLKRKLTSRDLIPTLRQTEETGEREIINIMEPSAKASLLSMLSTIISIYLQLGITIMIFLQLYQLLAITGLRVLSPQI